MGEDGLTRNADEIVKSLWSLSDELMFRYADGFRNFAESETDDDGGGGGGEITEVLGYPTWWLKAVGYEDGPPPPPTKPKCCDPPKGGPTENETIEERDRVVGDEDENGATANEGESSRSSVFLRRVGHSETETLTR